MSKIKVLVADEETLFRDGVCAILKLCDDVTVVGEASNGKEIIEMVDEKSPDIVVMNLTMPVSDSAEVIQVLRNENKNVRVLLLSQDGRRENVLRSLRTRANGHISKQATADELTSAVLAIYRGEYFLHPTIAKTMVEAYSQLIKRSGSQSSIEQLTPREKKIFRLLAESRTCQEIARQFDIEPATVLRHRAHIMRKLGIHSDTELIKYAVHQQMLNVDSNTGRLSQGESDGKQ